MKQDGLGIDQYSRQGAEYGYEDACVEITGTKSCDRVRVNVNQQSHQKRRAQARERMDGVGDAQHGTSLRRRGDFSNEGGAQGEYDAANRAAQSHQGDLESAAAREGYACQRDA